MAALANLIIPKKANQFLFISYPDFTNNPKAFYNYLKSQKPNYEMIWIIEDITVQRQLNSMGITAYLKNSVSSYYQFFRSKYIVVSHSQYSSIKSKNQFLINLWHGIPLKTLGFLNPSNNDMNLSSLKKEVSKFNILISSSNLTSIILSACFILDPRRIPITGQPRNDKLFNFDSKKILNSLLGVDLSSYNTIILYCPTYRVHDSKVDGEIGINIIDLPDFNSELFSKFLSENRILYLIKPHPFEEDTYEFSLPHNDNICIINSKKFQEKLIDFYDILGSVDILVTDYSSIYFDFLLLNRPIIFIPLDFEIYSNRRGLILSPYDFWTPGPKIFTFPDFLKEIQICINNPSYYQNERMTINNLINQYQDNHSCERLWDVIKKMSTH